jgi:hypothetical protein
MREVRNRLFPSFTAARELTTAPGGVPPTGANAFPAVVEPLSAPRLQSSDLHTLGVASVALVSQGFTHVLYLASTKLFM